MIYHFRSKFVISVLALAVILTAYGYLTEEPAVFYYNNNQNEAEQQEQQIQQQFREALGATDIEECAGIADEARRLSCERLVLSQRAFSEDDVSICSQIPEVEQDCVSDFNTKKAAQTGDETFCEDNTNKDACYFRLAISKSDESFCAKITDATVKGNCLSVVGD